MLLLGLTAAQPVGARGVYQTEQAFLAETFDGTLPDPAVVWLIGDLKPHVQRILGHPPPQLRLRYWRRDDRSAWILEEIGKELPITTGVVVHEDAIERVRVLTFRETRGDEVRHPFFTRQFEGAALKQDHRLDRHIDGITGATLSVRALKKLARLALLLHRHIVASP